MSVSTIARGTLRAVLPACLSIVSSCPATTIVSIATISGSCRQEQQDCQQNLRQTCNRDVRVSDSIQLPHTNSQRPCYHVAHFQSLRPPQGNTDLLHDTRTINAQRLHST
eukprot:518745-Rhodomonas_salina.6